MDVGINREGRPIQRVRKNTTRALLSNPWERQEKSFRLDIRLVVQKVKGQVTARVRCRTNTTLLVSYLNGGEEGLKLTGALPVESAGRQEIFEFLIG
jgi:hypothetical protein